MRLILFILAITATCVSCKKNKVAAGKDVEIYLLKTYQPVAGKCQVDAATAVLEDLPAMRNEDIFSYSKTSYQFTLSNSAIQKVNVFNGGAAFAVTVDKQVIYYGILKLNISSSSCDHSITMDVMLARENKIQMNLGYPGLLQGVTIDDQRNNPTLIATLNAQGKLK